VVVFLKRCLHKDRKQRVAAIADVALALEGAFDGSPTGTAHPGPARQSIRQRALPAAASAFVALSIAGLVAWRAWPAPESRRTTRFDFALPEGQLRLSAQRPVIAISADGRHFVYETGEGLYVRSLDSLQPRLIPGITETVTSPFLSPDGQSVGFFTASGLKRVSVDGGTPVLLCQVSDEDGASWGSEGTILFAQRAGIMRVSADGGTPELIVRAADGEEFYGPQMLPGGQSVLFTVTREHGIGRWDQGEIVVQSLSSNTRTVVVQGASAGRYVASGHLVYAVGDALLGGVFDGTRLVGGAVSLLQGVQRSVGFAAAGSNFAVSDEGTLVYAAGYTSVRRPLLWVNRDGTSEAIASIPAAVQEEVRLSSKGDRVLVARDGDIWIYELSGGRSIRVTRNGSSAMAAWDPAGSRVAYLSTRGGSTQAWVSAADGSGEARQLTHLEGQVHVDSWSPDGKILTIHDHREGKRTRILMLRMDRPDAEPEVFVDEDYNAEGATFSPDGRHVAFVSTATGQREVYIRPYPGRGRQMTASVGGGQEAVWAANGELFYRSLDGQRMFSVSLTGGPDSKPGTPVEVFKASYYIAPTGSPRPQYDVASDGKRFLMLPAGPDSGSATAGRRIVIVQNWFEELKRLAPLK
jgi:serine/threonine-protein kinase